MKIVTTTTITAEIVETTEKEWPTYTRYGPDSWTNTMGESEEQVYDCEELEKAYQDFKINHT